MSDMLHLHDTDGTHVGNVCVPGPFDYQALVLRRGERTPKLLGKPTRSRRVALRRIADALGDQGAFAMTYNRGEVWASERGESYYDPIMVFEVRRL